MHGRDLLLIREDVGSHGSNYAHTWQPLSSLKSCQTLPRFAGQLQHAVRWKLRFDLLVAVLAYEGRLGPV